jgi:hypothetical protein
MGRSLDADLEVGDSAIFSSRVYCCVGEVLL